MSSKSYALFTAAALTLSLGSTGCLGDVEGFVNRGAVLYCKRIKECDKSFFDERYKGDMGRCKDDAETDALDVADDADEIGCDYQPEEGRICVKAARKNRNDCSDDADDEIADECEEVFKCPGGNYFNGALLFYDVGLQRAEDDGDLEFTAELGEPATWPEDEAPQREYVTDPDR